MVEVFGGGLRVIDNFVVTLSTSSTNLITTYTGEHNVSVIDLGYQLLCTNSKDCPNTTVLSHGQSNYKHHSSHLDTLFPNIYYTVTFGFKYKIQVYG